MIEDDNEEYWEDEQVVDDWEAEAKELEKPKVVPVVPVKKKVEPKPVLKATHKVPETPEEIEAEKARIEKEMRDSDYQHVVDLFGEVSVGKQLSEKSEFDEFSRNICKTFNASSTSPHAAACIIKLVKKLADNLDAKDVKALSASLNQIAAARVKSEKPKEVKKTGKKKMLNIGSNMKSDNLVGDLDDDYDDEYDFM